MLSINVDTPLLPPEANRMRKRDRILPYASMACLVLAGFIYGIFICDRANRLNNGGDTKDTSADANIKSVATYLAGLGVAIPLLSVPVTLIKASYEGIKSVNEGCCAALGTFANTWKDSVMKRNQPEGIMINACIVPFQAVWMGLRFCAYKCCHIQ